MHSYVEVVVVFIEQAREVARKNNTEVLVSEQILMFQSVEDYFTYTYTHPEYSPT